MIHEDHKILIISIIYSSFLVFPHYISINSTLFHPTVPKNSINRKTHPYKIPLPLYSYFPSSTANLSLLLYLAYTHTHTSPSSSIFQPRLLSHPPTPPPPLTSQSNRASAPRNSSNPTIYTHTLHIATRKKPVVWKRLLLQPGRAHPIVSRARSKNKTPSSEPKSTWLPLKTTHGYAPTLVRASKREFLRGQTRALSRWCWW